MRIPIGIAVGRLMESVKGFSAPIRLYTLYFMFRTKDGNRTSTTSKETTFGEDVKLVVH